MVISGEKLRALIDKYDAEAAKNDRTYMETGIGRYQTAARKAEDLADTLRVAKNAAEEHNKLLHYRSMISILASSAREVKEPGEAEPILKQLIALARMDGLIRKEE